MYLLEKLQAETYGNNKEQNAKDYCESLQLSFSCTSMILSHIGIYLSAECTKPG